MSERENSDQSAAVYSDHPDSHKELNYSINVPNTDNHRNREDIEEDILDSDDEKIVPLIRPLTINRG